MQTFGPVWIGFDQPVYALACIATSGDLGREISSNAEIKSVMYLCAEERVALMLNGGHILDAFAVQSGCQDVKGLAQHRPLLIMRRRQSKLMVLHHNVCFRVLHLLHQVRLQNTAQIIPLVIPAGTSVRSCPALGAQ